MSAAAYRDDAVRWSKEMTRLRSRCPGDTENAMRSIERDYGIDYGKLWQLRYRASQIKDIGIAFYMRLWAAYDFERERQRRLLAHDNEITKQLFGPDHPLVVATEAFLGESGGEALEVTATAENDHGARKGERGTG